MKNLRTPFANGRHIVVFFRCCLLSCGITIPNNVMAGCNLLDTLLQVSVIEKSFR